MSSAVELVAKRGYRGTTVEQIVKRAGVARVTFYENFDNREDCLLACFEYGIEEARSRMAAAALPADGRDWPQLVRAGLAALLDYVASEPALARTCLVETVTAGPKALAHYGRALESFTFFFSRGRELADHGEELPETLEESIVGGIVFMIHQRLVRGETDQIRELLPTVLQMSVAPYLGEELAAKVAASEV
ncbi:MAG TPA: TetR/AcrR family transcriptional regulator [Solirubrobacterales bacterium]|jgi:AcrR family transcriptional regulator|nr:TetR/AcrR family transcriptional regulator [Solirubrobacterales bacterium]